MSFVWAACLVMALLLGWVLTVLAMPGNWLMLAATAVYIWLGPGSGHLAIGANVLIAMLVLALLGEAIEALAGMYGVTRAGGSHRAAVLALAGSLTGAVVGVFVGVPVPVVGQLIAAILFAGVGATLGAVLGEQWKGRDLEASWRVGVAAFWGRVLGTLAKVLVGSAMVVLGLLALATAW